MPIEKPPAIAADPFKSAKWDELTAGRRFRPADAPALALLCQWHKIADAATDEMESLGGQTAYTAENGDLKPMPQVQTLKAASAEIRALSKQLGIDGETGAEVESGHGNVLSVVAENRANRRARAAG